MTRFLDDDRACLIGGDMREVLATLPENSISACVCDPPYEFGFMGKSWDSSGVAFDKETWCAVLRVLKPGGHLLAFSGTRTSHRMVCAIEDAGFEIRDSISWIYGTGFPKSLDVAKAIDKKAGHWRGRAGVVVSENVAMSAANCERTDKGDPITAAATWDGWGTALKPALEPVCVARKSLEGTVTENVQRWGAGAVNIEGCKVGDDVRHNPSAGSDANRRAFSNWQGRETQGRWPANIIFDEEAAEYLSEDARRFFYCAKASRAERERGCDGLPPRKGFEAAGRKEGSAGLQSPRAGASAMASEVRNFHPTVKPAALMRWLVRLVTPPGGVVLDPFTGSGTTGIACALERKDFIGIELLEDHAMIAAARIKHALEHQEEWE